MPFGCVMTLALLLAGGAKNDPLDIAAFVTGDAHLDDLLGRIAEHNLSIWDVYYFATRAASPRTAILLLLGKPDFFSFWTYYESWTYSSYGMQIDFDGYGIVKGFQLIGLPGRIQHDTKALQGVWGDWNWHMAVFEGDRLTLIRREGISCCGAITLELSYQLDPARHTMHLVLPETLNKHWEDIPSDLTYSLQGDTLQLSYTKDGKQETINLTRWRQR